MDEKQNKHYAFNVFPECNIRNVIFCFLVYTCNPRARRAKVQDIKAKCVNVVRGSHVCGFTWCWREAVSRE